VDIVAASLRGGLGNAARAKVRSRLPSPGLRVSCRALNLLFVRGHFDHYSKRYAPAHQPSSAAPIETTNPIELSDFVSAFTSIASQYEKFVRSHYPEMSGDANIFVREVRAGSIEADLIPWALQGLSAVVNVTEQIQIVDNFVRTYGGKLSTYIGGSKEPEATRSDLKSLSIAILLFAKHD
jgi:hypothetical protein